MSSRGTRKHIALMLAVWLALPVSAIHFFHYHPTSIFFLNANISCVEAQGPSVSPAGHRLSFPPQLGALPPVVMLQETPFCPICLFIQNFHSQTLTRGIPEVCFRLPESCLTIQDDSLLTVAALDHARSRAPPVLPA